MTGVFRRPTNLYVARAVRPPWRRMVPTNPPEPYREMWGAAAV